MKRASLANIEHFGGQVLYEQDFDDTGELRAGFRGLNASSTVVYVGLGDELASYADVTHPTVLMQWFHHNKDANAVQFEKLCYLKTVRFLDTGSRTLTDKDLFHLRSLTNLECLVALDCSNVTDKGISHLATLRNLRVLSLHNPRVSDKGIACLSRLRQLERLDLNGAPITGSGLSHLNSLTNLRVLGLRNTLLDDNALVHLMAHTQLERLSLGNTGVTDQGLVRLRRLNNLTWLDLSKTDTTFEAREELGKFLVKNPIVH